MALIKDIHTGLMVEDPNTPKVTGYTTGGVPLQGGLNNVSAITADSLKPETPIELPQPPTDDTNYNGIIAGGSAMADSINKSLASGEKEQSDISDMLSEILGANKPESLTENYSNYFDTAGIGAKEQNVIDKQKEYDTAKKELDLLNAEMAGLNAEATAVPIQIQEEFKGRGVTTAGIRPFETGRLRQIALRSLPLQSKILVAQANAAYAQGNTALAQKSLELAQDKLTSVFNLKSKDIENTYNYKKDQQDKIWNYLTAKEKDQLTAQQEKDKNDFELLKLKIANANTLATKAMENGQADVASKIALLDPKSPTFDAELSALQGKINIKQDQWGTPYKVGNSYVQKNTKTGEIRTVVADEKNPTIAEQLAAQAAGFSIVNGNIVSQTAGIVTDPTGQSYDITSYATDPNHETSVKNLVANMGQFKTVAEIDAYIQKVAPGSPITGEMIKIASDKFGGNISWETIAAIMQQDSNFGTLGAGARSFNPGNVGNTETATSTGKLANMGSWQKGVDAVAEWLNNHKATTPNADITVSPDNQSLLAQTGLSIPAFSFLTKGTSALTRMTAGQRLQYMKEAENYLNKTGTDIATFQSQYNALGKTVEANSLRNNQAGVAEAELDATINNLATAADEASFKGLRWANVAKMFAGKEINDPTVEKYAFHLQQLREEFAMYNAAIGGQIDANGNIRQINDADYQRAENIIKDGLAKGGIEGFKNALTASRSKMQVVLQNSIDAQNKQVWKLFGVEDKFKNKANNNSSNSPVIITAPDGQQIQIID